MGFDGGKIEAKTPVPEGGSIPVVGGDMDAQCLKTGDDACRLAADGLPKLPEPEKGNAEGKRIDFSDPDLGRISMLLPPNFNGKVEVLLDGKGQGLESSLGSGMNLSQRAQEGWKNKDGRAIVVIEGNIQAMKKTGNDAARYNAFAKEGTADRVVKELNARLGKPVSEISLSGASLGGFGVGDFLRSDDSSAQLVTQVNLLEAAYRYGKPAFEAFAKKGGKLNVAFMERTTGYVAGEMMEDLAGLPNVHIVKVEPMTGDMFKDHKQVAEDYYGTFLGLPKPPPAIVSGAPAGESFTRPLERELGKVDVNEVPVAALYKGAPPARAPQVAATESAPPKLVPGNEHLHKGPSSYAEISPDGSSYKIDYKGNKKAEAKIGMGEMLPADVISVRVFDASGAETCPKAIRVPGKRGFRNAETQKYVPVKQGYTVNVLERRTAGAR